MEIIWSNIAKKQLLKLERHIAKRVFKKVGKTADNPDHFIRRLFNSPYFKIRIGDYRAIIDVTGDRMEILKVEHRGQIYKNL